MYNLPVDMNMDLNKLRKTLEIVFEYLFRTVGLCVLIAGFWLYFTEQISERVFVVGLGAGSLLTLFGNRASLNFLKFIKEKKDVTGN
jgi:hypothetical protein